MNAPLLPLKPIERLSWMRHFTALRCKRSCEGFEKGHHYPMTVETVRASHKEHRARRNGIRETVTITGSELMIVLMAGNGWRHRFLSKQPETRHPIIHDFEFLARHFVIPEVPDVVVLNPTGFETYKARLRALER